MNYRKVYRLDGVLRIIEYLCCAGIAVIVIGLGVWVLLHPT